MCLMRRRCHEGGFRPGVFSASVGGCRPAGDAMKVALAPGVAVVHRSSSHV